MAQDRPEFLRYRPAKTIEYRSEHPDLSPREREVLRVLSDAVRAMGKVYVFQENTNMYPSQVSEEKLREAAKEDPEILDPYTVVRQDESGQLYAQPYHEVFAAQLEPVAAYLREASNWASFDPDLKIFLSTRAKNLLDGNYEESEAMWLTAGSARIRAVVGFYDRYPDTKMNRKFYAFGSVGSINEEETDKHQMMADQIVMAYESSELATTNIRIPEIRMRVDRTEVVAGLPADMGLTADSLPCQMEWRAKYGTEIIIYEPPYIDKFRRFREPIIREVISVERRRSQTYADLQNAYGNLFDAHEVSHALIRREGDEERFGNEYAFMSEMSASVIGMALLSKVNLNQRQLEAIFEAHVANSFDEYRRFISGKKERQDYLEGDAAIFNYLLRENVIYLDSKGDVNWNDIKEVYEKGFLPFAVTLERMLRTGNTATARNLKRNLSEFSVFQRNGIGSLNGHNSSATSPDSSPSVPSYDPTPGIN